MACTCCHSVTELHHVLTLLLLHTDGLVFSSSGFIEMLMKWVCPSTRRGSSYRWRWSVHHVLFRQLQQMQTNTEIFLVCTLCKDQRPWWLPSQRYSTSASRDDSRGGIPTSPMYIPVHLVGFRPPGDLPPRYFLVACGMFVLGMLLTLLYVTSELLCHSES